MPTEFASAGIDATQIAAYRRDGYLVVRGVFSSHTVAALDAEANRFHLRTDLIDQDDIRCRWQNDADAGACRFDCFDPVIDLSPLCGHYLETNTAPVDYFYSNMLET